MKENVLKEINSIFEKSIGIDYKLVDKNGNCEFQLSGQKIPWKTISDSLRQLGSIDTEIKIANLYFKI